MHKEEKAYLYWLHNVPGVGDGKMRRLIDFLGSAQDVYFATDKQLMSVLSRAETDKMRAFGKEWKVKEAYEKMTALGMKLVCEKETEYPSRLRAVNGAPYLLYYKGQLPEEKTVAVAIIGARECSEYGRYVAKAFASRLAEEGVNVISGMARGIDGIGQEAALTAGGKTFAVLGCGADICYPAANRKLYEEIVKNGGILSPYPPGTSPQKTLFPYRNKIVAGLSDAVLVVEARQKSGTWITVDMALEQGKDVYAVPGRVTDRLSDGCNLLIKQGAGMAISPDDLLKELSVLTARTVLLHQDKEEKGVLRFLDLYPLSIDEILERAQSEDENITLSGLMFELIQLCMQGKAKEVSSNYFVKTG